MRGLLDDGHAVDLASDGSAGLRMAGQQIYDVLVVDRMLPCIDGLSIVQTLRGADVKTPVLFMTSVGGIEDRVGGFKAGGDDYLVKPFALAELVARVNALGRRPPINRDETILRVADLELNLITRKVMRGGRLIDFQPREFKLLEILMRNKGRILTRSMLLKQVWDFDFDPRTSIVGTHISRVRAKIDRDCDKPLIRTLRGTGYSIDEPD